MWPQENEHKGLHEVAESILSGWLLRSSEGPDSRFQSEQDRLSLGLKRKGERKGLWTPKKRSQRTGLSSSPESVCTGGSGFGQQTLTLVPQMSGLQGACGGRGWPRWKARLGLDQL